MFRRAAFFSLTLVLALAGLAPAQNFFFKDGDVVVVMGDSITEQQLYSNYLEMWTVSRFPAWKISFRNVGIGGDTSGGGNSRFQRDVAAFKPTALTVDFGMNDGRYRAFDEPGFNAYMKGLQGIADQAKKDNIRVAWVTPQPIERREPGKQLAGYNETLEKYSEGVGKIAKDNGGLFCDQFHPYLAVMDKARESDPKIIVTGGDAVHPGPPGQSLMAASILKAMSFPREVSSATIDFAGGAPTGTKCKITDVEMKDGGVRFKRLDEALPFFPREALGILKWTPLLEEMNEYGLQVKGLKPGKYEVRVGYRKVGDYSADELAKGVNLAAGVLARGPIAEQVEDVFQAVNAKTRYFHDKIFRGITLAGNDTFKDVPPAQQAEVRKELMAQRMRRMPELDDAIRHLLVMHPNQFEVVPASEK